MAVSDVDWPTVSAADPGAIEIAAIGITVTVIVDEPDFPSLVAVTVAVPAETPVTLPVASTVATCVAPLAQTTERPVSTCWFASYVTALSGVVPPTTIVAVEGITETDATGAAVTVTTARVDWPPALAAICALPTPLPVTTPDDEIVMMVVSALDQNTDTPVIRLPVPSRSCA
jgi:hypothetical protein